MSAILFCSYMAIMYPLRPRMGKVTTICIALNIWVGGCLLSLPMLLYSTTAEIVYSDHSTRIICYANWPDGPTMESYQEFM